MDVVKNQVVVLIVASQGYQPLEYLETRRLLEQEGITVLTASDKKGGAIATDNTTTPVDMLVSEINPEDYNGIFFIGGSGALECLDTSTSYHLISQARKFFVPYGAICISTRILAKAGGLVGRRATGWDGDHALQTILTINKAVYVDDKPVVTDGLVVTATGPESIKEFAEGIVRVLTKKTLREDV